LTAGVIADGIRQTPTVIENGVSTTGEIIQATPGPNVINLFKDVIYEWL
jgi:hypothetical protein